MRRLVALVAVVGLAAAGCEAAEGRCSIDQVCAEAAARFGVGGRGVGGRFALRDLDGDGRAEWVAVSEALGTLAVTWGASGQATTWSLGQAPADLVIADVDGDGRLDVAAPLGDEGALALVRGVGPGRLGTVERVAVGLRPAAAAAADLDGDGRAEVVVADGQTGELRVVRAGPRGLWVGAPVLAGQGPAALVAGEFSGDGRVDVAVTLAGEGVARLFLGTGDGGLVAGATLYTGAGPGRAAAADLDGDGALDLVVVDALLDEVAVVHGDGAGGARETRRWPVAAGPVEVAVREGPDGHELWVMSSVQRALTRLPLAAPEARTTTLAHEWHAVAVGDVDGDGEDEVAVRLAHAATALREAPGYGFQPWYSREAGGLAGPVAAADLDGDGWLDLVVSDRERGELALLRGQEGGFAEPVRSPGPKGAEGLALADLDGDGAADVVAWRRAGYLSVDTVRKGTLWSARGVGDRFEGPVEFEFGADPRQVVAFDRDGDGRSELLALQVRFYGGGPDDGEDAGSGLLTLQLADDAFALVDRAMSEEFAAVGEVLAGEFSPDHPGDELIRVAGGDGLVVLSESRSAGAEWRSGPLPDETRPFGLTRADVDGDGIADLLVCSDDGLVLAPGLAWNEFAPGRRIEGAGCHAATVAELDGDGRPDLITTARHSWGPRVEVRLGHALPWLPRFLPGGTTTASNRPIAVAVADFDRDGLPDLAASGTDGLQVLRGGPLPVLRAEPEPTTGAGFAGGLQLADVDGDGREEVVALGAGGDVGLGRFDESGSLGHVQYDMSKRATEGRGEVTSERKLTLDVDGDGVDELLWSRVVPERGLFFTELQRVKGGRFVPSAAVAREIWPISQVRVADLDGDGADDLAYVHQHGALATHLGGPEGPGPAQAGPQVPYQFGGLSLGDVDRDGRVDAILTSWDGETRVHPGDGQGGFLDAPRSWPMGMMSGPPVTADLDGDGFGDLLAGAGADKVGNLRVCYGGPDGPRGDCRNLPLGPDDAEVQALAVEDVDGDGATDVLAVVSSREARRLVLGRGGEGRLVLHEKPLPRGGVSDGVAVDGALRRVVLDDEGPEWVYVDAWEVTRLGVRAR